MNLQLIWPFSLFAQKKREKLIQEMCKRSTRIEELSNDDLLFKLTNAAHDYITCVKSDVIFNTLRYTENYDGDFYALTAEVKRRLEITLEN